MTICFIFLEEQRVCGSLLLAYLKNSLKKPKPQTNSIYKNQYPVLLKMHLRHSLLRLCHWSNGLHLLWIKVLIIFLHDWKMDWDPTFLQISAEVSGLEAASDLATELTHELSKLSYLFVHYLSVTKKSLVKLVRKDLGVFCDTNSYEKQTGFQI